jgi:hypothetical protein
MFGRSERRICQIVDLLQSVLVSGFAEVDHCGKV